MPGLRKRERLARRAQRQQSLQEWLKARDEEYLCSLGPNRWQQVWNKISIILELMATNILQGYPALDGYDWSTFDVFDLI